LVFLNVRDDIAAISHKLYGDTKTSGTDLHRGLRDAKQSISGWFSAQATLDGEAVLAHSWTTTPDQDLVVCLEIQYPSSANNPTIFMVVEAGMISGVGMNSQGLAVAGNCLFSTADDVPDYREHFYPMTCCQRLLLERTSVADAQAWCNVSPQHTSRHVFLAEEGGSHSLELTPLSVFTHLGRPGAPVKLHANQFASFEAFTFCTRRGRERDRNPASRSHNRVHRLQQLIDVRLSGKLSREDIAGMFWEEAGTKLEGACDSPADASAQEERTISHGESSTFLVMLNPKRRIISVCRCPPGKAEMIHFTFDQVPELDRSAADVTREAGEELHFAETMAEWW
jgi:isopenicillin-N N-acyltransferase-like protein